MTHEVRIRPLQTSFRMVVAKIGGRILLEISDYRRRSGQKPSNEKMS
jgi:hypothetical protein